jgi:hypothetical protein
VAIIGGHVVATATASKDSRRQAIDFMAYPTRFERVTFAFGGRRASPRNSLVVKLIVVCDSDASDMLPKLKAPEADWR